MNRSDRRKKAFQADSWPLSSSGQEASMKKICVIDGQGGGIGAALIKHLKETYGETVELIALGTNAIATAQMLKAGANRGASGENAIVQTVCTADLIVGPIAITWANAMLGEVTSKMAEAITSSPAPKALLPLTQESVVIVGVVLEPLPHMIQRLVKEIIKEVLPDV
jgi:NAD(P)-dependent dehydrogenase (short-subunit alcohol dehydrogenase family)